MSNYRTTKNNYSFAGHERKLFTMLFLSFQKKQELSNNHLGLGITRNNVLYIYNENYKNIHYSGYTIVLK